MKITSVLIQLIAPVVLATDHPDLPLPGLETKPHLWHLKRDDLSIDGMMGTANVTGVPDGKPSIIWNADSNAPKTEEQLALLDEHYELESKLADEYFGKKLGQLKDPNHVPYHRR